MNGNVFSRKFFTYEKCLAGLLFRKVFSMHSGFLNEDEYG